MTPDAFTAMGEEMNQRADADWAAYHQRRAMSREARAQSQARRERARRDHENRTRRTRDGPQDEAQADAEARAAHLAVARLAAERARVELEAREARVQRLQDPPPPPPPDQQDAQPEEPEEPEDEYVETDPKKMTAAQAYPHSLLVDHPGRGRPARPIFSIPTLPDQWWILPPVHTVSWAESDLVPFIQEFERVGRVLNKVRPNVRMLMQGRVLFVQVERAPRNSGRWYEPRMARNVGFTQPDNHRAHLTWYDPRPPAVIVNELAQTVMDHGRFKHDGRTLENIYQTEWSYVRWCMTHGAEDSGPWLKRAQSYFVLREQLFPQW